MLFALLISGPSTAAENAAFVKAGAVKADAKNDDAKNDDAKNDDAKNDDAKNGDAKSDDAKNDDAKSDDAKSDDAKNGDEEESPDALWSLVPTLSVQLLGNVESGEVPTLMVRRLRLGLKLKGPDWIDANVEALHEPLLLMPGEPPRAPRLREARVTLRIPGGPRLSLGAFRAQVGRESLTPGFQLDSAEKASTSTPLRIHLTGRNTGVAAGINLGDLVELRPSLTLRYDVGLVLDRPLPNGVSRPPLLLARAELTFGTSEAKRYALILPGFLPARPGFSVALQGSIDTSGTSSSLGVDLLQLGRLASFTVESHVIMNAHRSSLLVSSARGGLHIDAPWNTVVEPWLLTSHLWQQGEAAAFELGAGLAWWINEDRLRVSAGGTSRVLASEAPRRAPDPTPRAELLFQIRI